MRDVERSAILRFFDDGHLPAGLEMMSKRFCGEVAETMDNMLPAGAEKAVCLRKLLEAKDAGCGRL